ncbi:MAG: NAD(P)H-dependent oxidoreductase subunit E [Rhodospirillales bacterium]
MSAHNEIAVSGPPFAFTEDNLAEARRHIAKYPEGRQASALLPLLHLAQRQNAGFLTLQALDYIADFLQMPPIRVYEVATFYTMFKLQPMGRYHVEVCTNVPCWLRGSDDVVATCRQEAGCRPRRDHPRRDVHGLGSRVPRRLRQCADDADR